MRKRKLQILTTLLLLALSALVGGVGSGLHLWFDCCDCCRPTCNRNCIGSRDRQLVCSTPMGAFGRQLVEHIGKSQGGSGRPSDGRTCPICSLLQRYDAASIVTVQVTRDDAIVEWLGEVEAPIPRFTPINVRARGPPSSVGTSSI